MASVSVKMSAFYGYSCMGMAHGSEKSFCLEVTDRELESLKKLGKKSVARSTVVDAIENSDESLSAMHERLEEAGLDMVEEYWLFEAYNEFLEESLLDAMQKDIEEGLYEVPISFESFVADLKRDDIDFYGLKFGYFDDIDDEFDYDDDEALEGKYESYILNAYYDWVCEHSHSFIADRVGVSLESCWEDEVDYEIKFSK